MIIIDDDLTIAQPPPPPPTPNPALPLDLEAELSNPLTIGWCKLKVSPDVDVCLGLLMQRYGV